jgi:hypothetical protein
MAGGQFSLGHFFQTGLHQTWSHLHLCRHMAHGAIAGLLAQVLTQAFGGALSPATGLIRFGETPPTRQTTEPPLEEH